MPPWESSAGAHGMWSALANALVARKQKSHFPISLSFPSPLLQPPGIGVPLPEPEVNLFPDSHVIPIVRRKADFEEVNCNLHTSIFYHCCHRKCFYIHKIW